jgi:hypothetical protein
MTSLLRLYPRDWRDRYEDEFLSLLAERPPDVRDRFDIVRGAIDARIRPQVRRGAGDPNPETPRASASSRALGWLVVLGAVPWFAGFVVAANGPVVVDGYGTYRDGSAALPFGILAFVLLGAGLVQVARMLPHGSDAGGLAASAAAVCGVLWAMMPWVIPLFAIASVGYIGLAVVARRSGVWGRTDAAVLVAGISIAWVVLVLGLLGRTSTTDYAPYLAFWVVMASVWLAVGHALIVGDRSPVAKRSVEAD